MPMPTSPSATIAATQIHADIPVDGRPAARSSAWVFPVPAAGAGTSGGAARMQPAASTAAARRRSGSNPNMR